MYSSRVSHLCSGVEVLTGQALSNTIPPCIAAAFPSLALTAALARGLRPEDGRERHAGERAHTPRARCVCWRVAPRSFRERHPKEAGAKVLWMLLHSKGLARGSGLSYWIIVVSEEGRVHCRQSSTSDVLTAQNR